MQFNSPYAALNQNIFSPAQTAGASAQAVNQLGRQYNMQTAMKTQGSGARGTTPSLSGMLAGQGQHEAARRSAPIAQRFQDDQANAQHQLGLQNASEQYGQGMLGRMLNNLNYNQSPRIPLALAHNQLSQFGQANNWLGALLGQSLF